MTLFVVGNNRRRGADRTKTVHEAKSKLQNLGIMATDLNRRTSTGVVGVVCGFLFDRILSINVVREVARLRDAVTDDPFEEPDRPLSEEQINDIRAAANEIVGRINPQFNELYN